MNENELFIQRVRTLASLLVAASDLYYSLGAEYTYRGLGNAPESGGLAPEHFTGFHQNLTPAEVNQFMFELEGVLGPLTADFRRLVYKLRTPRVDYGAPPSTL